MVAGEPAQTVIKSGLKFGKVLIYVWWNWQGIISDLLYYQNLNQLIKASSSFGQQERNCVSSRQHQATHIDSDPSEAPWSLITANDFSDEKFALREAHENRLAQVLANRGEGFYKSTIMKLSSKWQ